MQVWAIGGLAIGALVSLVAALAARRTARRLDGDLQRLQGMQWCYWWLRNAAEMTPIDARRVHFLRLAVAAVLAPSLAQFQRDLHSIAGNKELPDQVRTTAQGFLNDLTILERTRKTPWEQWALAHPGTPMHRQGAIAESYACALTSWLALFTRDVHESVPSDPGDRGSNSLPSLGSAEKH